MLYPCISSALSTTKIICVMYLFVHCSCVEDIDTIFLRPVFTFSLNVHFIFCKPTLSDISIFFILVEFHNVDDILACMLTMLMLMLLKIYIAILMMNKILKVLYITILMLLLELVMAPMIWLKRGGIPPCALVSGLQVRHKQQTNGLLYLCLLMYSGVLYVTFCPSLLLVMYVPFIPMSYPLGHAH